MKLLRNMQLKILAIILAMLLWFHVATDRKYDLEIVYHISYQNLPGELVIAESPTSEIGVMMRGSGKALMRLMWGDRKWPVDLTRARVGRQRIHLQSDNVPLYGIQGLSVIGLLDDSLTLVLDSMAAKTVPVRSAVEITTSAAHVCSPAPILTPDSVHITGPKSALASIFELWTGPQTLSGISDPVERILPLAPAPAYGVHASVTEIRFYQKVEPYLTRTFDAVPVRAMQADEADSLEIWPGHVRVELAGPESAVIPLHSDSILVTCVPLFHDGPRALARAAVSVPAPLEVLKVSPESVTVERREHARADSGD